MDKGVGEIAVGDVLEEVGDGHRGDVWEQLELEATERRVDVDDGHNVCRSRDRRGRQTRDYQKRNQEGSRPDGVPTLIHSRALVFRGGFASSGAADPSASRDPERRERIAPCSEVTLSPGASNVRLSPPTRTLAAFESPVIATPHIRATCARGAESRAGGGSRTIASGRRRQPERGARGRPRRWPAGSGSRGKSG